MPDPAKTVGENLERAATVFKAWAIYAAAASKMVAEATKDRAFAMSLTAVAGGLNYLASEAWRLSAPKKESV
jgi:hypothetical protein